MNGTPRRTLYLDANVFDQINRGNLDAARTLRRLLDDPNVDVRVPPWIHRELVDQPDLPRTAAANRLMLADLRIQQGAAPNLAQRVDVSLNSETASGGSTVSLRDRQLIASARAGNAEIWSFDRTFRNNAAMIQSNHGVRVAPESQSVPMVQGTRADYRVGRQLMGLMPVDISFNGSVTRRGHSGGGGSSGGAAPQQPVMPSGPATPSTPSARQAAPRQASAPQIRVVPRTRVTMSQRWGRLGGTGRAVGGVAAGGALSLLGAYIQSRVDQRWIERDFQEKESEIQTDIAGLANEIVTAAVTSPSATVYANISFRLEYHILWDPADRIEQTVYGGLTIDNVRISTRAENTLGDMPHRRPGQLIAIVRVSGTTSIPLPVGEMFLPADLARARILVIENMIQTMSLPPAELRRLNDERNALLNQL
jgi:hypothetical protein